MSEEEEIKNDGENNEENKEAILEEANEDQIEQEQQDIKENVNNEEAKEGENNEENINMGLLGENENGLNENKEEELNIANNENENENEIDNNININQENTPHIYDEMINKEPSLRSSKNNSNENINLDNGLSFARQGLFEVNNGNRNKTKNTYQILNEINNDMDLLEKDLRPIFNNHKCFGYNNIYNNDFIYDDIDKQNNEIKELIKKANKIVNGHSYNYYGYGNDNHKKRFNKYNLSEIYPHKRYENGGDYSNYMERSENTTSEENDNDIGYMRNISPEQNINRHRIKNIRNIYEYNNSNNYNNKPMIYRQNETFPIKNSYMNQILGQPQTYQKYEYPNNLVFSSDKISFRQIKHGGNINQSLDVLFNGQK